MFFNHLVYLFEALGQLLLGGFHLIVRLRCALMECALNVIQGLVGELGLMKVDLDTIELGLMTPYGMQ
ncbi:hypothetical protein GIW45_25410 [Pseudomonas congelans]|uniref:hypothetical protein n=1 Tax=Pseudomonas congelans TaxID=200452 RepID=UPI001F389514|nr:hypothetical protein [Pseudomonas congelans]MCF5167304.1 hypothetical protein [Pseudomonas congelans]